MNSDNYEAQTLALIFNGTEEPGHLADAAFKVRQTDPARADAIADRALHTAQELVGQLEALSTALATMVGAEAERDIDRSTLAWLQVALARQSAMWIAIAANATPETAPRTLKAVA
jgi:hypothetical protein